MQGATDVTSSTMLTRLGGGTEAFQTAPEISLTGDTISVRHESHRFVRLGTVEVEDASSSGVGGQTVRSGVATFESWLDSGSEMVAQAKPGPASRGGIIGQASGPTPLEVLQRTENWTLGVSESAKSLNLPGATSFSAEAGSLVFRQMEFSRDVRYVGDFVVYVFGADLRIDHGGEPLRYQSGYRIHHGAAATDSWFNVTMLTVHGGRLDVLPGSNPVVSFASGDAAIAGTGTVVLRGASGHLQQSDQTPLGLEGRDMNLVGEYQLNVRGSDRGLLAGVVGDFEPSLLGFASGKVAASPFSWSWLLVGIGLVAVGGAGGLLYVRRRSAAPAPTPLAAVVVAHPIEVPEAPHVDPDFAWDELNDEFGVVRAGEKSGILIVLVPENRIGPFLQAVVARGLMAEDTGDRVHAADNTLAVIALEPSPLMMN